MPLSRRTFLHTLATTTTALTSTSASARSGSPAATSSTLRVLPLRHSTLLAEVAGRRVLFDPSLSPSFSTQGVFSAPPAARAADELGPIDLICISSGEATSFDPRTLDALDARFASVLVGDDDTARRVRQRGLRRVRVVRPGDPVDVVGLRVVASPGRGLLGPAVGFVVGGSGGPRLWHTGSLPPLEVDAAVAAFASDHAVDVVLGCAWGLRARTGGPPLFADLDDVAALARLAKARVLMPVATDAVASGLFSLVWERETADSALDGGRGLRIERPVNGTWYRLATT